MSVAIMPVHSSELVIAYKHNHFYPLLFSTTI